MDFEVKGFCAENLEEKIHKRYLRGNPLLPRGLKLNNQTVLGWPAQGRAKAVPWHTCTGHFARRTGAGPMPAPSPP